MPFEFKTVDIRGLVIIQPRVFPDGRGYFKETFKQSDFEKNGVPTQFKQDNVSNSAKGVLRGLHFQKGIHAQGKLVQVLTGRVWDVAVDLRPDSPTFKKWFGIELSAENHTLFYIPPGFGHGFLALEDNTTFMYKCTQEYNKDAEGGVKWDDPNLGITWPAMTYSVAEKDQKLPGLVEQNFDIWR